MEPENPNEISLLPELIKKKKKINIIKIERNKNRKAKKNGTQNTMYCANI